MEEEENRSQAHLQRRKNMLAWLLPLLLFALCAALIPRGASTAGPPMRQCMNAMNKAFLELGDLVRSAGPLQRIEAVGRSLIDAMDRDLPDFPPYEDFAQMWRDCRATAQRLLVVAQPTERKAALFSLTLSCERCHFKYRKQ